MQIRHCIFSLLLVVSLSLGLTACGGDDDDHTGPTTTTTTSEDTGNPSDTSSPGNTDTTSDTDGTKETGPYADSDATPPAPISNPTISPAGSLAYSGTGDLMEINLSGFAAPVSGSKGFAAGAVARASTAADVLLSEADITVVEDGKVQGIVVEKIDDDTRAAADVLFVIDTTGSMGAALQSVQDSIVAFTDFLDSEGLDVRLGAVTVGDAYDTTYPSDSRPGGVSLRGDTPPEFDNDARPSFPFSTDFAAFKTFIQSDSARGGGDTPENTLGALEFGYHQFDWRAGAQKVLIVITDVCSHNETTFSNEFGSYSQATHWMPPVATALVADLKGNATVHVVAPAEPGCGTPEVGEYTNMADMTGVDGTGGVFVDWGLDTFDLTTLPIAEATAGGYLITYKGLRDGSEHQVRVVINNHDGIRGELTFTKIY